MTAPDVLKKRGTAHVIRGVGAEGARASKTGSRRMGDTPRLPSWARFVIGFVVGYTLVAVVRVLYYLVNE